MDKLTFYSVLREKLSNLDIRSDYIDKHISQFENFFNGKNDEQIEEEISKFGDVDRLASRIKRITDKMILSESAVPVTDASQTDIDVNIAEDENQESVKIEDAPKEDIFDEEFVKEAPNHVEKKKAVKEKEVVEKEKTVETVDSHISISSADEDSLKSRAIKFRILFICLLPLIAIFYLLTFTIFSVAFFIIAMLTVLASFSLALITIAGSAVFIFGLIFGVVQALNSLPVGIYECGLSVIIGSVALICGILAYNFTVRLMPFVASQLLSLFKFVFRKYRIVYIYFKKEYMQI